MYSSSHPSFCRTWVFEAHSSGVTGRYPSCFWSTPICNNGTWLAFKGVTYPIKTEPLFTFLEGDSLSFSLSLSLCFFWGLPQSYVYTVPNLSRSHKTSFSEHISTLLHVASYYYLWHLQGLLRAEVATPIQCMCPGSLLPVIPRCPWKLFHESQGCNLPFLWGFR